MTVELAESGRDHPWVPNVDTFGARLALVRQRMGWGNVKKAAEECGLPAESWRTWERDGVTPHRMVTIAIAIATRTGCDLDWLVYGPNKPSQSGGKVNVDYPLRRDPLAAHVLRQVGGKDKVAHGDFRRRQPNGRGPRSNSRITRPRQTVSSANHTAPVARNPVA
jgi:hypothetical protein